MRATNGLNPLVADRSRRSRRKALAGASSARSYLSGPRSRSPSDIRPSSAWASTRRIQQLRRDLSRPAMARALEMSEQLAVVGIAAPRRRVSRRRRQPLSRVLVHFALPGRERRLPRQQRGRHCRRQARLRDPRGWRRRGDRTRYRYDHPARDGAGIRAVLRVHSSMAARATGQFRWQPRPERIPHAGVCADHRCRLCGSDFRTLAFHRLRCSQTFSCEGRLTRSVNQQPIMHPRCMKPRAAVAQGIACCCCSWWFVSPPCHARSALSLSPLAAQRGRLVPHLFQALGDECCRCDAAGAAAHSALRFSVARTDAVESARWPSSA